MMNYATLISSDINIGRRFIRLFVFIPAASFVFGFNNTYEYRAGTDEVAPVPLLNNNKPTIIYVRQHQSAPEI